MKYIKNILLAAMVVTLLVALAPAQINWTSHIFDPSCVSPRFLYPVDFDDDGDVDIVGANNIEINWYENNGYQIFWKQNIDPSFTGASKVCAADMDGDGDIDVLAGGGLDHIAWYENDGNENFTYHFLAFLNGCTSVNACDMDDDDDMDVVATSYSDDKVAWYENIEGIFMEHIIETLDYAYFSVVADFDDDDDLDVVVCGYISDVVKLYINDGNQNFTAITVATLDGAYCVDAADLDGDDDIDIAAIAYTAQTVMWYQNDGANNFTEHNIAVGLSMARFVNICDIDNDDDNDILVAGYGDSYILMYLNDGSGNFTENPIDYYYPWCVRGADVDSDGDLDILATSYYGYYLTWLESDLNGAFPLELTLTPATTPVQVPPGGGSFQYEMELVNNSTTETFQVDIWIDVILPTSYVYPIYSISNVNIAVSSTLLRTINQSVPGSAMPGWYNYTMHVRDHNTWEVYLEESFDFEKLEGVDAASHNTGWALLGWEDQISGITIPSEYAFEAPYPNPFNPSTNLIYELKEAGYTTLTVYNIEGKEVACLTDAWQAAGTYQVQLDASSLSSGIYFAKLTSGDFSKTQKLLLSK